MHRYSWTYWAVLLLAIIYVTVSTYVQYQTSSSLNPPFNYISPTANSLDSPICVGEALQVPVEVETTEQGSLSVTVVSIYRLHDMVPVYRPAPIWTAYPEKRPFLISFVAIQSLPDLDPGHYLYVRRSSIVSSVSTGFEVEFEVISCD